MGKDTKRKWKVEVSDKFMKDLDKLPEKDRKMVSEFIKSLTEKDDPSEGAEPVTEEEFDG